MTGVQTCALPIWVVDVATKKARELTHSTDWTVAGAPQWSPDGTRLTINTHPTTLVRDERRGAFIVDVASGRLTPVAGAPAIQSTPVWSPDGTTLAFTTLTQAHAPHADGMMEREQRTTHLTLYDVASGKATDLYDAKQFDEDANGIRWPLQGQLFFTAQDRAWSSLYTVVLGSGTATYKKTRFDGQLVGAVAFSKDAMKTVLALSSSSAPADLYFTRLDAMGERTRLTNANPQLASEIAAHLETPVARSKTTRFSDGESFVEVSHEGGLPAAETVAGEVELGDLDAVLDPLVGQLHDPVEIRRIVLDAAGHARARGGDDEDRKSNV